MKITAAISYCMLATLIATQAQAQNKPATEFSLNGLAAYEKLRKEYYVGALLVQTPGSDSINFVGKKRMDMRVSINKWSPRRFSGEWSQAIFLNNDQELINQFTDQIQAFIDLPKSALMVGDQITVDMDPDQGTTVYLNGNKAFNVADTAFFDVLLNVWIGKRPPSSDFRTNILTLPAGQAAKDLLTRFKETAPTDARKKEIASWFNAKSAPIAKAKKAQRAAKAAAPAEKPVVTQQNKPAVTAAVTAAISGPITSKIEVESPIIALDPPPIDVDTTIETVDADTKAAKTTLVALLQTGNTPKVIAAETDSVLQEQLRDTYGSDVLKLTYLNTVYPERAIKRKQRGKVALKVKVNRKGEVIEVTEAISSKYKRLNKAAKRAIQKTAPYPKPPKELLGDSFEFVLPFNFKL